MKFFSFLVALSITAVFSSSALATDKSAQESTAMVVTDTWNGKDKRDHFVGSLGLGVLARGFVSTDPFTAGTLCMIPGVAKEIYDARKGAPGAWSWKDLVADGLGCGVGIFATDLVLTKDGNKYTLWLNKKF